MEKLTNAELLEDTVANSNTLKNKRLEKTSVVSGNPNPNPVNNSPQVMNDNVVTEPKSETSYVKDYIPSVERNGDDKEKQDDNKIFGINKFLFYGLVTTAVVVGGYFVYNKYFKKSGTSKAGVGSSSSGNTQAIGTSNIAK